MSLRHHPIEREMKKVAPDVECVWNDVIERWQVYQVMQGAVLVSMTQRSRQLKLMWTIQTDNGSYRDPGSNDLRFLIQTVEQSRKLWDGNADRIADDLDAKDTERETQIGKKTGFILHELAREMGAVNRRVGPAIKNPEEYAKGFANDLIGGDL